MTDKHKERKPSSTGKTSDPTHALAELQVDVPVEQPELKNQLDEALQKSQEYLDGLQRERADFINYRRRIERDQQLLSQTITAQIIRKYLAVSDDLERALKTRPTLGDGAAWAQGVELIYRKLQNILDNEGLQTIPAGEQFDPNRHEAISHEDSPDHSSGQIIEIVQQGYTIGDRVIRPAMVRVAR